MQPLETTPPAGTGFRSWALPLVVAYAVLLAVVLLSPTSTVQTHMVMHVTDLVGPFLPVGWPTFERAEAVLNAVIVAPFGFLVTLAFPRVRWIVWAVLGLLGAASVEAVQWAFLSGRHARIGDVVADTVGACVGAGVGVLLQRRRRAQPPS